MWVESIDDNPSLGSFAVSNMRQPVSVGAIKALNKKAVGASQQVCPEISED